MPLYNYLKAYLWPSENIATVDPVKRQCFHVVGITLLLKMSHLYYFQVQLQLLITGVKY